MSGTGSGGEVGRFLLDCVEAGWMPGAVWWIEGDSGAAARGAVGLSEHAGPRRPAALGTPYDLASLTKPLVTGLLLALLEQQGVIDLEAPLDGSLRDLCGTRVGAATWLDLAVHRAGLPAWRPLYLDGIDADSVVRRIADEPPVTPPGTTLYSDLGYILLGRALEELTGQGLQRLFEERVVGPLGLRRLGFASPPGAFVDAAPTEQGNGYERRMAGAAGQNHSWRERIPAGEVHDANAHALGGVAGHAGLFGTVESVAGLARELLRTGKLGLDRRARSRLLDEACTACGRTVGFVVAAASRAARGILNDAAPGHTGFTGTSLWLEPRRDRFYVLLTNRVHPQVAGRDFQWLRRGFHRLATRCAVV